MSIIKEKIIPYTKFHRIWTVCSIICGVLWIGYGVADHYLIGDSKKLLPNLLAIGLLFVSVLVINFMLLMASAMRDKEDELYRQNIAKANSMFLWVLFFIGFGIFMAVTAARIFFDKVTLPLHSGFLAGIMYLLNAVYHLIALHYEKTSCEDAEDE